jgi:hypothetical protein
MTVSTYKGYELIVTGAEVDTWGDKLNTDVFNRIDANLGGLVSKSLTNVDVTLTADENRQLILRLTGTLTGAVNIVSTLQGMMMVENLTSGSFAVTYDTGVGTPLTLAQGFRTLVISDATNGPRKVAGDASEFASGTRMLFQQTSAPTGWTKDVSNNNKALRLVSGAVGSGGTVAFTTAFASQSVAGSVGNTALSIAQMPLHGHTFRRNTGSGGTFNDEGFGGVVMDTSGGRVNDPPFTGTPTDTGGQQLGGEGGGGTHTHTFTGTAIDLAVQYVDCIIAAKD